MPGVYVIQNTVNGKCYVGSAIRLSSRMATHRWLLRKGMHHSPHLQASWNKHGETAFRFWVAEECPVEIRREREQWWIDSFAPAYNIAKSARGPAAGRPSWNKGLRGCYGPSTLKAMSHAKIGKSPWNKGKIQPRRGCSEAGCERLHLAKGLCSLHYQRVRARRHA